MKVGMFNTVRGGAARFAPYVSSYKGEMELVQFDVPPTIENLELLRGCEAIICASEEKRPEAFWAKMSEVGVRFVVTPTASYDHLDLPTMAKYGIKAANVPFYSPNAISEHTVLSVLALLRMFRKQILRIENKTYGLAGLMGKELRNQTVGIVGAGRIGYTTMKCLSGFGVKRILANDVNPNEVVKEVAEYVSLDELFEQADVIIFHCVYNESNHHMVNEESIAKMKDGVYLVNVARGPIFDTHAVLEGVKSEKIAGVAIDVLEENRVFEGNGDHLQESAINALEELLTYPNVIFTNNSAFLTDEADKDMCEVTISNIHDFITTGECIFELKS